MLISAGMPGLCFDTHTHQHTPMWYSVLRVHITRNIHRGKNACVLNSIYRHRHHVMWRRYHMTGGIYIERIRRVKINIIYDSIKNCEDQKIRDHQNKTKQQRQRQQQEQTHKTDLTFLFCLTNLNAGKWMVHIYMCALARSCVFSIAVQHTKQFIYHSHWHNTWYLTCISNGHQSITHTIDSLYANYGDESDGERRRETEG